jgi:hypothetical protein
LLSPTPFLLFLRFLLHFCWNSPPFFSIILYTFSLFFLPNSFSLHVSSSFWLVLYYSSFIVTLSLFSLLSLRIFLFLTNLHLIIPLQTCCYFLYQYFLLFSFLPSLYLKGQSHEKVGEIRPLDVGPLLVLNFSDRPINFYDFLKFIFWLIKLVLI